MPRKKRLFALLLSLCMVVAMVPVAVLAAGAGMPQNIRWAESPKSMVQWDAPSGGGQYQYELRLKLGETIIDGPDFTVQRYHLFNGSLMTEARENYTVEIRARSCIIVGEFPNEYVTSPGEWGDWATLEGSGGGGEGPTPPHEHIFDGWQKDDTNHWKECSCGEKLNVANHAYGEWSVTKPATTTEEGSRERTCSVCEYTQKETIPVHVHSIHDETWKYDDTNHWKECSCGEKLNVANHAYGEWSVTKPATTTEEGSRERTCSVCEYTQKETIPVHVHSIHDETWKYDDTNHWKECSCGEKLNVANHAYGEWSVTKPATETEEGSKARDCTVCDHVQTETIPMLEHEHGIHDETWKYDKTQHWQECSCGEKLNVANHIYGDWKVTKEATETEVGSRERGCTVCEYVQVEIIPEIGHEHGIHDETWKYDETDHWQECSCGEKLNVANHTYGDWKVTKEATETEAGSRERGCAVCEYVQTEAIPAAGTGEPTDSTDPTDSSDSQGQQDPSGDTGSPQTGDGSDMALWIGLMMASCGGVLGMLFYRRKKAAAGK
ncbi:LPXTG cell wall anchor domain-containing protein [Traorella massiliensis]|uniref:LPXTG cell wall anchor domain-containing protein n=1 Tax=Traorella massiliensis TaxID=1903263 RepID=UPI0008F97624|nr:LPXTG cell wall anchor domain-containing protein [Traorella massiliensis]